MTVSEQTLQNLRPLAGARFDPHLPFIASAMAKGQTNTLDRIEAFLAQLAHESKEDLNMQELADGSGHESGLFSARVISGGHSGQSHRPVYWDRNRALVDLPLIHLDKESYLRAAFQRARVLVSDGFAGPKTFAAVRAAA